MTTTHKFPSLDGLDRMVVDDDGKAAGFALLVAGQLDAVNLAGVTEDVLQLLLIHLGEKNGLLFPEFSQEGRRL